MVNNSGSLRQKIIHSLSWSTLGFGSSQILRFVSNIVLTRLLYPEAFGLMIIAQSIIVGLTLLTDMGIKTVIIQDEKGNEQRFLNTAWVMMIAHGFIVFLLTIPMSFWAAHHYNQPELVLLIIAIGFTSIITCLESTKLTSARRQMLLKEVTILTIVTQIVTIISTLLLAWWLKNVWAIVLGNMLGAAFNTACSHLFFKGEANRFEFDRELFNKIFHFSKWIIVSSSLTFFAGEGNKLLIGHYLPLKELAIYGIATNLSGLTGILTQVFGNSLFPAFSEVYRSTPEKFHKLLTKARLLLINASVAISVLFVVFGHEIATFIYDQRYDGVGEYLRILSIGAIVGALTNSYFGVLLAIGRAKANTIIFVIQIIAQFVCIYIGHAFYGSIGVVAAIAIVNVVMYLFTSILYARLNIWQPKLDFPYLLLALVFTLSLYHF
jgi:O-antigen/teichoic acid export membrane protein